MPNIKKTIQDWPETGKTVYFIFRREADDFLLNNANGQYADNPADAFLSALEHAIIKGRYELSESRAVWNDGRYTVVAYKQIGAAPVPANDVLIGSGEMVIKGDAEVYQDVLPSSMPGLNWTHATRKLTSALTDEVTPKDMATAVSVLPFPGSVQASYAKDGQTVEIIQGDSVALPYDLGTDLTGWTVWFAAKTSVTEAAYSIAAKEITASVTDLVNGRGTIPITAAELNLAVALTKEKSK